MTPKRAKELLPIFKAFSEGKDIQFFSEYDNNWEDTLDPVFSNTAQYRIKPEKKTLPFESAEEFLEVMASKASPFLVSKQFNEKLLPIVIDDKGINIYLGPVDYLNLYHNYTFDDGTPCGKIVEE